MFLRLQEVHCKGVKFVQMADILKKCTIRVDFKSILSCTVKGPILKARFLADCTAVILSKTVIGSRAFSQRYHNLCTFCHVKWEHFMKYISCEIDWKLELLSHCNRCHSLFLNFSFLFPLK